MRVNLNGGITYQEWYRHVGYHLEGQCLNIFFITPRLKGKKRGKRKEKGGNRSFLRTMSVKLMCGITNQEWYRLVGYHLEGQCHNIFFIVATAKRKKGRKGKKGKGKGGNGSSMRTMSVKLMCGITNQEWYNHGGYHLDGQCHDIFFIAQIIFYHHGNVGEPKKEKIHNDNEYLNLKVIRPLQESSQFEVHFR